MTTTDSTALERGARLAGLVALALAVSWVGPLGAAEDPIVCTPTGQFIAPPPAPLPTRLSTGLGGAVYEVPSPPGLDPSRPVLVFVHGLHGSAGSWGLATEYYGRNDMIDAAYDAGYKIFLVDLWDASGTAETSVENGRLLKAQIDWIASYWGVEAVNVVAHSKGGPDSNVAALMGAPIDTIVSLSGAHWGSPLADLAQTGWLEWLADLLGANDAGTKFMQTGCMELARGILDGDPGNDGLSIYTTAGTGWGPFLSALELGGLYLATVCPGGDSDGVVCVDHAEHPWARDPSGVVTGEHRVVWDRQGGDYHVDHDGIRMGNNLQNFIWPWEPQDCYVPVFDSIEPYAGVFHQGTSPSQRPFAPAPAASPAHRGVILRGGPLEVGAATTEILVEPGVETLYLRLMLSSADVGVSLTGPSGRRVDLPRPAVAPADVLPGGFSTGIELERPDPGLWRLALDAAAPGGWAALALVDGELDVRVAVERDRSGRYRLDTLGPAGGGIEVSAILRRSSVGAPTREVGRFRAGGRSLDIGRLEPGVYNLAVTLRGLHRGSAFERNAVLSLGVAAPGGSRLPEVCR